ncbi:hypothetical protein OO013_07580 [Mangrovivirga sp. M17]|uniref:Uncharacterized protein n=1 Tax=Mangrovivirga halotolerans TaxID=2993936 RepID=A0ABT3RPL0_9BACT|nr:hypothetical protein [Mangrovivirga halotolerans]MCX2743719.1 hypothetical protein [Mangrovivirga halotolerans]
MSYTIKYDFKLKFEEINIWLYSINAIKIQIAGFDDYFYTII